MRWRRWRRWRRTSLAHRSPQDCHQVLQCGRRILGLNRILDASGQVLPHDYQGNLANARGNGIGLLDLIQAVAIIFQHLSQTAHLPFDFPQTPKNWFPFFRGASKIKATVYETMLHRDDYTPREYLG
jgi:hypothetical protein